MLRDNALHRSQSRLRSSQHGLAAGEMSFTSTKHRFCHRHKMRGLAGKLLDGSQRLAAKAPNLALVPGCKLIADEHCQYAHRHPVPCFFGSHTAAPQTVM